MIKYSKSGLSYIKSIYDKPSLVVSNYDVGVVKNLELLIITAQGADYIYKTTNNANKSDFDKQVGISIRKLQELLMEEGYFYKSVSFYRKWIPRMKCSLVINGNMSEVRLSNADYGWINKISTDIEFRSKLGIFIKLFNERLKIDGRYVFEGPPF